MKRNDIVIYGAGKTWAAPVLRAMKKFGFNINSSWIDAGDLPETPTENFSAFKSSNKAYKRDIWDNGCKPDAVSADAMIMLCFPEDGESHSGSLVELGHVSGQGKPVYVLGTCESVEPVGHSNRAFMCQQNVHHFPEFTRENFLDGFKKVIRHYQRNYVSQWKEARLA